MCLARSCFVFELTPKVRGQVSFAKARSIEKNHCAARFYFLFAQVPHFQGLMLTEESLRGASWFIALIFELRGAVEVLFQEKKT